MPSTRITVAVNANQTQKTVLLIPFSAPFDPSVSSSCYSLVVKTAQAKLRLKKPSRIFVAGGYELETNEDWKNAIVNDVVLLVSTGEDYIGTRSDASDTVTSGKQGDINPECPIVRLNDHAEVDSLSLSQLKTTAQSLPGIIHAVAQPDLHPGTKHPIGSVFVSKGWIHPPLIGSDIGCGMAWYKTTLSQTQVESDKGRKVAEKLRGLEGAWKTHAEQVLWLAEEERWRDGIESAGKTWDASLGTIGAGNHFAELQVVEEPKIATGNEAKDSGQLSEGDVMLLIHSGSRGYGGDILKRYTKDGRDSIPEAEAESYLKEHDHACRWAQRNRDLIALRFLSILEPGDECWTPGLKDDTESISKHRVRRAFAKIQERKVVDIWHNNIEPTLWPPLRPGTYTAQDQANDRREMAYIHRKGAAPAIVNHNTTLNSAPSILPLPGSRATPTIILHPTFTPANDYGRSNGLSLAHGAGRARSRADAAAYMAEKYKGRAEDLISGNFMRADRYGNKQLGGKNGRDVNGGTWVVCEDKQLIWEEAGEAYKDVWKVADDLVAKGCAEIWGWCRGRVSYKVRKE